MIRNWEDGSGVHYNLVNYKRCSQNLGFLRPSGNSMATTLTRDLGRSNLRAMLVDYW